LFVLNRETQRRDLDKDARCTERGEEKNKRKSWIEVGGVWWIEERGRE
jgi:hypothetical protein